MVLFLENCNNSKKVRTGSHSHSPFAPFAALLMREPIDYSAAEVSVTDWVGASFAWSGFPFPHQTSTLSGISCHQLSERYSLLIDAALVMNDFLAVL